MLKALRNKSTQKKIYLFLAIVIIPPFVLWGTMVSNEDSKKGLPTSVLGVIRGKNVSIKEYLNSYTAIQHQLLLRYGDKINEIKKQIDLKGQAWDRLLLLNEARSRRLKASDEEVVRWMVEQPVFFRNGVFDQEFYKLYVERFLHTNTREFEEETRSILILEKLREELAKDIHPTDEQLRAVYQMENSRRDVVYGVLPFEKVDGDITIKDEEIASIYPMLKDRLTDKEDGHVLSPEEAKIELTTILKRQKALEIALARLKEISEKIPDQDLERALKAESIEVKRVENFGPGTDLPGFEPSELAGRTIGSLSEGQISAPIKVSTGAAIFKVNQVVPADMSGYEKTKDALAEQITSRMVADALGKLVQDLRKELIVNADTMSKIFDDSAS